MGVRKKPVGQTSRAASAAVPPDLRWEELAIDGRRVLVLSHAIEGTDDVLARLTSAQRAVAVLAAEGLSNDRIARVRETATATVAKLLEGAYRRLGVHSRAELVSLLSASRGRVS